MLASIVAAPNIAIDESEAETLAKAIGNVTRHYNVPTMAQETLDWIMLIQAGGAIYGPRLLAWKMERASRRVKPVPQSPMAPQHVAPAPTAPNAQPATRPATPMPPNVMNGNAGGMRVQPGLADLDGADRPIKPN